MPSAPVIVVLYQDERPPGLVEVEQLAAEVRYVRAAEFPAALAGADVVFMWDFTSRALDSAAADDVARLSWIHVAGAGVDRALAASVLAADVVVTNSRGVFDQAIAEYVAGLVLLFAKDLGHTLELQRQRTWQHRETESVAGQNVVVVGSGPIGRAIGRLLQALGLRVRLVGRTARPDPTFGEVVGTTSLLEELPAADYVVLAAPLTPQTAGMVDARALARMRPTARLINVGRGGLVAQADLVAALERGQLGGAALDVFEQEPLPADSPLWTMPGVVVSPHMSADFTGWLDALAAVFVDNLRAYVGGHPLSNVVDKQLGYVPSGEAETG